MAAMLAEIKSRILLPRSSEEDEDEEDPRAQLIRSLQASERSRDVAERVVEPPALPRLPHPAAACAQDTPPHAFSYP